VSFTNLLKEFSINTVDNSLTQDEIGCTSPKVLLPKSVSVTISLAAAGCGLLPIFTRRRDYSSFSSSAHLAMNGRISPGRGHRWLWLGLVCLLLVQHASASIGDHLPEFKECVNVGHPWIQ